MYSIEQIENAPAGENVIVLKAVYGKQQGRLLLQPARDRRTGQLLGVKKLSDEDKRKVPYFVDNTTTREITDGLTLDLSEDIARIDWEWIKHCPEIALSFDESQSSAHALFYVKNDEKEISERIKKVKLTQKALSLVAEEKSQAQWYSVARLLGNRMDHAKPIEVEEYLYSIAQANPQKLVDAYTDKDAKAKLFLMSLRDKDYVKTIGGVLRFGETPLGINESQAVEFIKNPMNASIIEIMRRTLYPEYFQNVARVDPASYDPAPVDDVFEDGQELDVAEVPQEETKTEAPKKVYNFQKKK